MHDAGVRKRISKQASPIKVQVGKEGMAVVQRGVTRGNAGKSNKVTILLVGASVMVLQKRLWWQEMEKAGRTSRPPRNKDRMQSARRG